MGNSKYFRNNSILGFFYKAFLEFAALISSLSYKRYYYKLEGI